MDFLTNNNLIMVLIFVLMLLTVVTNILLLTIMLQRQRTNNDYIRKIFALMQVATITNAKVKGAGGSSADNDGRIAVESEGDHPNSLSQMGI